MAHKKTGVPLCIMYDNDKSVHSKRQYRTLFDGTAVSEADVKDRVQKAHLLLPESSNLHKDFTKKWGSDELNYNPALHTGDLRMPYQYYQYNPPLQLIAPDLKDMLFRNEFKKDTYRKYDTQIKPDESAFMHVRRGDYIQNKWDMDTSFYTKALQELDKNQSIKTIYIVSNDNAWCKEQLPGWKSKTTKKLEILDIPDELETLYVMMHCMAGAVTPCSSFSMWGALFGANLNPNSTIVYPSINPLEKSFGANPQAYPARWIGI